jgi:hypothetical protein
VPLVGLVGLVGLVAGCADLSDADSERDAVLARTCLSFLARQGLVPEGGLAGALPDPDDFGRARRRALEAGEAIATVTPLERACSDAARRLRDGEP